MHNHDLHPDPFDDFDPDDPRASCPPSAYGWVVLLALVVLLSEYAVEVMAGLIGL